MVGCGQLDEGVLTRRCVDGTGGSQQRHWARWVVLVVATVMVVIAIVVDAWCGGAVGWVVNAWSGDRSCNRR